MAGGAERLDGGYMFQTRLPLVKPGGLAGRLLFRLHLVSTGYVRVRDGHMLSELNRHIFETVVADRKVMMERLMSDRAAVGEGVMSRVRQLEEENAALRQEYEGLKRRAETGGIV